jgi:hypothetical protein
MVIVNKPESHFIFVFHSDCVYKGYNYINYQGKPLPNKEYLEHWGKYVFFGTGEEMDELAKKFDSYVEKKLIPCIKYDRVALENLGLSECVMCVYCDDRQKDEVWQILAGHGVEIKAWVYEKETMERWLPGGALLEKWIAAHDLSEKEAHAVREDARLKFEKMFADENAIFTGVEQ